jgi:hypothetical protein
MTTETWEVVARSSVLPALHTGPKAYAVQLGVAQQEIFHQSFDHVKTSSRRGRRGMGTSTDHQQQRWDIDSGLRKHLGLVVTWFEGKPSAYSST